MFLTIYQRNLGEQIADTWKNEKPVSTLRRIGSYVKKYCVTVSHFSDFVDVFIEIVKKISKED